MMKLTAFILSLSIFTEIRGYTVTFRNEATHPLKAPTESTLGLQVNDDTVARTKSNEPAAKQEPVFSGGNHFEYMLLNDSNILLTSLQNDGPFDTAAAQFASSKQKQSRKNNRTSLNITADPTKSVEIEATPPPHNHTGVQNESDSTFSIISKTNFKIEPPVISSRPAISGGGKTVVEFIDTPGHPSTDPQKGVFDQRLLKTTKFLVNPLTKTEPDDYDDAFTKLLISNGILKPAKSIPYHSMEEYTRNRSVAGRSSPYHKDDNPNADTSVETQIKSRDTENSSCIEDQTNFRMKNRDGKNNTESSIQNLDSYSDELADLGVKTFDKTTTNYSVGKRVDYGSAEMSQKPLFMGLDDRPVRGNITALEISVESVPKNLSMEELPDSSLLSDMNVRVPPTKSKFLVDTPTAQDELPLDIESPRQTTDASVNTPSPGVGNNSDTVTGEGTDFHLSMEEPPPSSLLSDMNVRVPLTKSKFLVDTPTAQDELPLDVKSPRQTTSAAVNTPSPGVDNNSDTVTGKGIDLPALALKGRVEVSGPAPEVASLKKPPARSMLREFDYARPSSHKLLDRNDEGADRQLTIPEFEDFLKSLVQKLFNSVTDYVGKLNKPNSNHEATTTIANSLMHIKRFVLFNVTMVERGWLKRYPSLTGVSESVSCTFPWTNLLDNRTVNVQRHVNDLFDDDSADFFWFGVPLRQTAPYPLLTKKTFCDLFQTDLAVRVHLEYQGRKIEAVFALPRALAPNISMSAANLSVDVNAQTGVDSKRSEVVELLGSNVTVFRYDSVSYHILELGTSKLIPPKAMAKVWAPQHEDIETFINFILGSLCLFCFLSFMLYGVYRLIQIHPPVQSFRNFRDRYRFLERPKTDRRRRRSEALNVIFSENFDNNKYVNSSWLGDNSQHTSCILKPCKEISEKPATAHFPSRERVEASEHSLVDTVAVDSPRLNKENRVPMMGYRSYCILLPHTRPYDDDERCFENPNYGQDTR